MFLGKYCEQKIEYCSKPEFNPCQNDAVCVPINQLGITDYLCNCKVGWQGRNCSENVDDCKYILSSILGII